MQPVQIPLLSKSSWITTKTYTPGQPCQRVAREAFLQMFKTFIASLAFSQQCFKLKTKLYVNMTFWVLSGPLGSLTVFVVGWDGVLVYMQCLRCCNQEGAIAEQGEGKKEKCFATTSLWREGWGHGGGRVWGYGVNLGFEEHSIQEQSFFTRTILYKWLEFRQNSEFSFWCHKHFAIFFLNTVPSQISTLSSLSACSKIVECLSKILEELGENPWLLFLKGLMACQ